MGGAIRTWRNSCVIAAIIFPLSSGKTFEISLVSAPVVRCKISPTVTFRQQLCDDNIRGHQVRRELNAFERHAQGLAQGFYEERFTQTGHAFQQYVSTGKKGDEDFADNIAITNDDFLHFRFQAPEHDLEIFRLHQLPFVSESPRGIPKAFVAFPSEHLVRAQAVEHY